MQNHVEPLQTNFAGSPTTPTRIVAVTPDLELIVPLAGDTIMPFVSIDVFIISHDHPASPAASVGNDTVRSPLAVPSITIRFMSDATSITAAVPTVATGK
jgi:hypothetical protein